MSGATEGLRQRKAGASAATGSKDHLTDVTGKGSQSIQDPPDVKKLIKRKQVKQASGELGYNVALAIVTFLAFATRFWDIGHPGQVVFDEVHFGKFASYYLRREYYFDVHPPLGKMLLAAVAWFLGYDGHFLFDKIGLDYAENNVPYVGLRLFPASCGALIIPVVFLTLKELGLSVAGATFGAMLLVLDNALITQTRLILLDSMLTLFCVFAIYAWVRFRKLRHRPFTCDWYLWLALTGLGLALTTGVKMVGLLTVATVGIAVLYDLWDLLDIKRGLTMRQFIRHFSSRAVFLIFMPLAVYLFFFYLHFAILIKSGPGDAFMSAAFQDQLTGANINTNASYVPYYANITLRHRDTKAWLHSHPDKYPLRYDDGRVSSQGQQITGYPHKDINNVWIIEPVDPEQYPAEGVYTPTDEENEKGLRFVRNSDLVRLRHIRTDSYLLTHDVASPLTSTHMEMTTISAEENKRYNETLWRIELLDGNKGSKVKSKRGHLKLINHQHKVAVHCDSKALPDWGYGQQQVNGNKNIKEAFNVWWIDDVLHDKADLLVPKEKDTTKVRKMSFLEKFLELQGLMLSHNAGLTKPHPYSSAPIAWPFVLRGISFWEVKESLRQIYLLGNPIVWWGSGAGVIIYMATWVADRLLLRRGIDGLGVEPRRWWDRSLGFVFLCWLMHWIPFFLQARMLFLHHYLPSFIFSAMVLACVCEFFTGSVPRNVSLSQNDLKRWAGVAAGIAVAGASFYYFSPMTYGLSFKSAQDITARKWVPTWDFQHAA
ncbi:Dolichyl-phosphate-mannose-protein mannosyltransferase-domain-containing protein [Gaertneriomyces semiglobifer]|nr:Dolichyl-phosphate-mannose-protein mannosyltransferase-domain-containing protein [Gaertneriomyces semiglobifer]